MEQVGRLVLLVQCKQLHCVEVRIRAACGSEAWVTLTMPDNPMFQPPQRHQQPKSAIARACHETYVCVCVCVRVCVPE